MKRTILSLALVGLAFSPLPVLAQGSWGQSWSPSQAREARERGDIKPLKDIFRDLERQFGGYQISAELFSSAGGGFEYRISWMTGDGRKIDLVVDAETGQIVGERGT